MDPRALVASLRGALVKIDGLSRRAHRVRPPVAGVAITLLTAFRGVEQGSEGDLRVFELAASEWLPEDLWSDLQRLTGAARAATVVQVLGSVSGVSAEADTDASGREVNWTQVVADHAAEFGGNPLDLPWPLFMALQAQTPRVRARRQAEFIEAYTAAKAPGHEGKALRDAIWALAYPGSKKDRQPDPEWMTDEWVQEQIEKARSLHAKPALA